MGYLPQPYLWLLLSRNINPFFDNAYKRGFEPSSQLKMLANLFNFEVVGCSVGRSLCTDDTGYYSRRYSGIFTPTEAASVVVTTLSVGFMIKTISLSDLQKMLISSAKVNGVILPTVALSLPLTEHSNT